MSQHWATIKEAGALTGMRIIVAIYTLFGRTVFNVVLVPVMLYFFIRRTGARRASMDYLQRVKQSYPEKIGNRSISWLSFRHFIAFGRSLLDRYIAWTQKPTGIAMDPEQEELAYNILEAGQGCLVIGSHFGNLEYSRGISMRHPGLVINVLLYDQHAEKFSALMESSGFESRMNLIQVTDVDIALALSLKEKVDRGEWVVIAGDRVPVGEGKRVCSATFFGGKADFPVGPYVLANLLRCPVYMLYCFHDGEHYRVELESFEDQLQIPRNDRQQVYERATQKFASSLEKQVARFPLQWFNFYYFWGDPNE